MRTRPRPRLPLSLRDQGATSPTPCSSRPQRIAIEVELTLKSRARLDAIVRDLGETYPQVWYFAAPKLIPTLEEIATVARWQNVRVHRYPPLTVEAAASAQLV